VGSHRFGHKVGQAIIGRAVASPEWMVSKHSSGELPFLQRFDQAIQRGDISLNNQ